MYGAELTKKAWVLIWKHDDKLSHQFWWNLIPFHIRLCDVVVRYVTQAQTHMSVCTQICQLFEYFSFAEKYRKQQMLSYSTTYQYIYSHAAYATMTTTTTSRLTHRRRDDMSLVASRKWLLCVHVRLYACKGGKTGNDVYHYYYYKSYKQLQQYCELMDMAACCDMCCFCQIGTSTTVLYPCKRTHCSADIHDDDDDDGNMCSNNGKEEGTHSMPAPSER